MIKKILKENWYYVLAIIVLIAFFFFIENSNFMNAIDRFDNLIIEYNRLLGDKILYPMIIVTNIGNWYIPVILILSFLIIYKKKSYFYLIASFYSFSSIISFLTKLLIGRERPDISLTNMPSSYSFPSGHTFTSICFYFAFSYILTLNLSKKEKTIFISFFVVLSLIVGYSRIYLGVHYFSDVIGGIILSIPCILMFINIVEKNFVEVLKCED